MDAILPKCITLRELAEYLKCHTSTLYRLAKRGELPGFKVGRDWRFDLSAIAEWQRVKSRELLREQRTADRPRAPKSTG